METANYCQSCSLPLNGAETHGTNADGSKNGDYCIHCFENGKFTLDCTMKEMIDFCVPYFAENSGTTEEETKKRLESLFPNMKRWKKA